MRKPSDSTLANNVSSTRGKLSHPDHQHLIRAMVEGGSSLSEIRSALQAAPRPIEVTRNAIHLVVGRLGLKLRNPSIRASIKSAHSSARRQTDPSALRRKLRRSNDRPFAWLETFEPDLKQMITIDGLTFAETWDRLSARHGDLVPQLSAQLTGHQKTSSIAIFLHRRRKAFSKLGRVHWSSKAGDPT
ncbi:hypothetical protein MCEMSHM24_02429 [Comamonadaceae bacterium]